MITGDNGPPIRQGAGTQLNRHTRYRPATTTRNTLLLRKSTVSHVSQLFHSQHTNTQTVTPSTRHSHLAHITPLHSHARDVYATCNVYRAHRHGSESPHPGSAGQRPGLNPCNQHLAWQACGPWRTHRHNTYIVIEQSRLWRHEELMIHRNQRAAQPRRRGHHRAGGAGAVQLGRWRWRRGRQGRG